jgi:hypothetical protein
MQHLLVSKALQIEVWGNPFEKGGQGKAGVDLHRSGFELEDSLGGTRVS